METTHDGSHVYKPTFHLLASPFRTLCGLPQSRARLWLERALGFIKAQAFGLVLLSWLPNFFHKQSPEFLRHG